MLTPEEQIQKYRDDGEQLTAYLSAIAEVLTSDENGADQETLSTQFATARQRGAAWFNHWDNFVPHSGLLGAHRSEQWLSALAEDALSILKMCLKHNQMCKKLSARLGI